MSTVAAGLAHRAAQAGERTLLLSVGDQGGDQVTTAPQEVADSLYRLTVGPLTWAEGLVSDLAPLARLLPTGAIPNLRGADVLPLPGFAELSMLSALRTQWQQGWSRIVVDAGGISEALDWLTLPDTIASYLRTWWADDTRTAAAAAGHTGLHLQVLAWLEVEATELAEQLRGRRVGIHLVAEASTDRLAPTLGALTDFALFDLSVTDLVLTDWSPRRQRDVRLQQQLSRTLPEVTVRTARQHRSDVVQRVGAEVYASLPKPPDRARSAIRVRQDGDHFTLHWRLPFARPGSVQAEVVADRLTVTVGQRRRQVTLPSVLRRCVPRSAELADGTLVMDFVPDERLWPQRLEQE